MRITGAGASGVRWIGVLALALRLNAETLTLQIVPEQSSLTLRGDVGVGSLRVDLMEQGPGSLTAKFEGTIPVEATTNSLRFLPGAVIRAREANAWQPGPGGTNGVANASYAGQAIVTVFIFTQTALAATRHLVVETLSDLLPVGSKRFSSGDVRFRFSEGGNTTFDFNAAGAIETQGTQILSGFLTNKVSSTGQFEGAPGIRELTLPINACYGLQVPVGDGTFVDFSVTLIGKLVARAVIPSEERKLTWIAPSAVGGPVVLSWNPTFKLQSAPGLDPLRWVDVSALSPFSVSSTNSGGYFRVVPE